MLANLTWRPAERLHPKVITGVEVDRGDASPWWLDQRQSTRTGRIDIAHPYVIRISTTRVARRQRGDDRQGQRRDEEDPVLDISPGTGPAGSTAPARKDQRAFGPVRVVDQGRGRIQGTHSVVGRDLHRLGAQLGGEVD